MQSLSKCLLHNLCAEKQQSLSFVFFAAIAQQGWGYLGNGGNYVD